VYRRFDVALKDEEFVSLDETRGEKIENIKTIARQYIQENIPMLRKTLKF